jgi:mono/diheme cytochrome c family protein
MKIHVEVRALGCAVLVALASLGSAGLLAMAINAGPGSSAAMAPPAEWSSEMVVTPKLIAQGREFFGQSCSHCHGDDATGDEGPNLRNLSISNARIATTIKNGIKGEMPTFAKKYDQQQVVALVSYLRSLR